jgi:hypothetical protein
MYNRASPETAVMMAGKRSFRGNEDSTSSLSQILLSLFRLDLSDGSEFELENGLGCDGEFIS